MTGRRRYLLLVALSLGVVVALVIWAKKGDPQNPAAMRSAPASYERCVTSLFSRHFVPRRSIESKEITEGTSLPDYLPDGFLLVSGSRGEAGPVWADGDCNIIAMFSGQGPDVPESEPDLGRWLLSERPRATTFVCPKDFPCWVVEARFRDIALRLETVGITSEEALRVARSISR